MKPVIAAIDKHLLAAELTPDKFIRKTRKDDNEVYVLTAHTAPQCMLEIGRLRELSFRSAGTGTGNELDTDEFDYLPLPFKQLIVWNPREQEIIAGYRYLHGRDMQMDADGQPNCPMAHLFSFSNECVADYLPYSVELGRAFVHPDYQSTITQKAKSIYAFDNLWDGLLCIPYFEKDVRYFIGRMALNPEQDEEAKMAILYFFNHFLADTKQLFLAKNYYFDKKTIVTKEISDIFTGENIEENYQCLQHFLRSKETFVPAIMNSYLKLAPTIRIYGTVINQEYNNILDTASMIVIDEMEKEKVKRHIEGYLEKFDIDLF